MFDSDYLALLAMILSFAALCVPATAMSHREDDSLPEEHLVKKGGRKRSPSRGLPDDKSLEDLARTYLVSQHQLWPELVNSGVLPPLTDESIAQLALEFRHRYLDQAWQPNSNWADKLTSLTLAVVYVRFSSDNTNPLSLARQLENCLKRARQDGVFIPWFCVCADAAVTGTIANRRGYNMAKCLMKSKLIIVQTLFIDELGRAARSAIEALRLGQLISSIGKRLVGASDGFDTSREHHKLMLHIYAMLHEFYVDQLSQKVVSGMNDAYKRGRDMGRCAFGYRMEVVLGADGFPELKANGKPRRIRVIDEINAEFVREAFKLFVEMRWSPNQIAEHFNDRQVGGRVTWAYGPVASMLERPIYDGVEYRNQTQQVRDPDSGKITTIKRPKEDWERRAAPHLQIVDHELWMAAQARLRESRDIFAGKRPNGMGRGTAYSTTLIRPICWSCGAELVLGHSGKNPSFCCPNGRSHKHNCEFRGYKMVSIVESVILEVVQGRLVTPEFLDQLVSAANEFLQMQVETPKEDEAPIKQQLKDLRRRQRKLADIIAESGRSRVKALVKKLESCESDMATVRQKLRDARLRNEPPPKPLTLEDVRQELSELRDLLVAEKAIAAPILRALTGPIIVEQVGQPDGKRPIWLAKFTIDAVPALAELTKRKKSPIAPCLDLLSAGIQHATHLDRTLFSTSDHSRRVGSQAALGIARRSEHDLLAGRFARGLAARVRSLQYAAPRSTRGICTHRLSGGLGE